MKPQRSTDKSGASAVAAELGRKMRTLSIATDLDDGKERTSLQRDTRSSSTVHGTGGQSLEHNGKPAKKGGAVLKCKDVFDPKEAALDPKVAFRNRLAGGVLDRTGRPVNPVLTAALVTSASVDTSVGIPTHKRFPPSQLGKVPSDVIVRSPGGQPTKASGLPATKSRTHVVSKNSATKRNVLADKNDTDSVQQLRNQPSTKISIVAPTERVLAEEEGSTTDTLPAISQKLSALTLFAEKHPGRQRREISEANVQSDAVDMPQEIWRQFCSFLLHPLLSENLVTLKDADELRKQINWAKPRRPEITFSNADHYRASIKPAVFREVFCDVQQAVEEWFGLKDFEKRDIFVTKDGKPDAREFTESSSTLRCIFLRETSKLRGVRSLHRAEQMRSLDGRVRNQGMGKADDELPWNKELVIVEPWSCNSNKGRGPLQLAFAKRVSTGTDGCVKLQLWMNQPVPFCDVEKPFKISRLLQFSSYYRQIWALFVLGDHEFLTSAYVSLTPSVHISSNHKFGDRFRSLTGKLNKIQEKVVLDLAWGVTMDGGMRVLPLQGPPGTGKSEVVVALVKLLTSIRENIRILVTAPSNAAVDAVGRRIINAMEDSCVVVRFGHEDKIAEDVKEYALYLCDSVRAKLMLEYGQIFLSTLNSSGSCSVIGYQEDYGPFDVVIVDEAGQASQLDTMIPLTILRASKLILIGDPKQLPATVKDKLCQQADYSRSYLERICDGFRGHKDFAPMLKLQYRMNAAICNFPSDKFYGGQLKSDSSLVARDAPWKLVPFIFVNVEGSVENGIKSKFNTMEVDLITKLILACESHQQGFDNYAVITGYAEQGRRLNDRLKDGCMSDVRVGTVDGFQGQEKPVIIISCVRVGQTIGFLKDAKRLNVALTRAQKTLVIVGCANTLHFQRGIWRQLVNHAKSRGCYVSFGPGQSVKRLVDSHMLKVPSDAITPVKSSLVVHKTPVPQTRSHKKSGGPRCVHMSVQGDLYRSSPAVL